MQGSVSAPAASINATVVRTGFVLADGEPAGQNPKKLDGGVSLTESSR